MDEWGRVDYSPATSYSLMSPLVWMPVGTNNFHLIMPCHPSLTWRRVPSQLGALLPHIVHSEVRRWGCRGALVRLFREGSKGQWVGLG